MLLNAIVAGVKCPEVFTWEARGQVTMALRIRPAVLEAAVPTARALTRVDRAASAALQPTAWRSAEGLARGVWGKWLFLQPSPKPSPAITSLQHFQDRHAGRVTTNQ